jgi:hypothetical protein
MAGTTRLELRDLCRDGIAWIGFIAACKTAGTAKVPLRTRRRGLLVGCGLEYPPARPLPAPGSGDFTTISYPMDRCPKRYRIAIGIPLGIGEPRSSAGSTSGTISSTRRPRRAGCHPYGLRLVLSRSDGRRWTAFHRLCIFFNYRRSGALALPGSARACRPPAQ